MAKKKKVSEYERFMALSDAEKDAEVAIYDQRPEGFPSKPLRKSDKALHRLARAKGRRKPSAPPHSFDELVRLMPPMAIRDDVQHANTIEVIDRLMQIQKLSSGQAVYLETLVELVEAYEAKRHAIDLSKVTGVQMLRHVVNESGLSGSGLARLLGVHATMGSKILNGDRKLTWDHAKVLATHFRLSPALFMD
jgi:HTH-type transcriptional regulator / antitoxin HigA